MHWRTRHLRIKAKAFMEKQKEGALPAHHVPGQWNAADIGTKALPASRHWKLCDLLGLRVYPEHRPVIRKTQISNHGGSEQRLRALILACCLCAAKAQPGPQNGDAGVDRLLVGIIILIVVTTIALWEMGRQLCGMAARCCQRRLSARNAPQRPEGHDNPQPDAEDDLVEVPLPPPPQPPEEEPQDRPQRNRPIGEVHRADQGGGEAGLRQRGARVYRPEPDQEPQARLELAEHPILPAPPQPAVAEYGDDVVVAGAAAEAFEREREGVGIYAIRRPLPNRPGQGQVARPPVVRDFDDVRRENIRLEAEQRLLDLPPFPPLVVNPNWGPGPHQPPLRYLRNECTEWGGEASALHHLPPVHFRRDHYQIDHDRSVLIRWHCSNRVRLFTPENSRLPEPLVPGALSGRRRTLVHEMSTVTSEERPLREPCQTVGGEGRSSRSTAKSLPSC